MGRWAWILAALTLADKWDLEVERWNRKIAWRKLDEVRNVAEIRKKPVMVIVHRRCSDDPIQENISHMVIPTGTKVGRGCKAVKHLFGESKEIETKAKQFIMVLAGDEMEPDPERWGNKFAPDGVYYPRVVFLTHKGNRMNVTNNKEDQYKFWYDEPDDIAAAMDRAVEAFKVHEDSRDKTEL